MDEIFLDGQKVHVNFLEKRQRIIDVFFTIADFYKGHDVQLVRDGEIIGWRKDA